MKIKCKLQRTHEVEILEWREGLSKIFSERQQMSKQHYLTEAEIQFFLNEEFTIHTERGSYVREDFEFCEDNFNITFVQ